MNERAQKSILQMARGAIQERADYEMSRLLDNIRIPTQLPLPSAPSPSP